tara:strand:+ start:1791 stop:2243 length:453 start_codon:yes stop_codon:yes gene_type:complete
MRTFKIITDKLFTNITQQINDNLPDQFDGLAHIYTPHTTACIYTLEDELLHLTDVRFFLDKVAPFHKDPEGDHKNIKYLHDLISLRNDVPKDERINGHSHIRSLFFSSFQVIPFSKKKLITGEWKSLFFVELDPGRERVYYLNVLKTEEW